MRSGGKILVDQLRRNGASRIFTVPGESFLAVLDALHDGEGIDVIVCRHEGAAAMMAEATARLAGPARPAAGVAMVSRGPGLANAMSGLHVAMQGATPLLLLVGLPPSRHMGRGGFQEVSLSHLAGSFAKHVEIVGDVDRIPEIIARALTIAQAGRAGPAVVGFHEDVLSGNSEVADAAPVVPAAPGPTHDDMMRLAEAIEKAEWPIILAGGRWTPDASRRLTTFAERLDLPVLASFRSQDVIDNRSTAYCGHAGLGAPPKLRSALASADLVIAIGTHLDEVTVGSYDTIKVPTPRQRLLHVHPDPATVGRNHRTELAIVSTVDRFAERLDDLLPSMQSGMPQRWSRLRRDMRGAFEASQRIPASPGQMRLEDAIHHLSEVLPDDAIITNGAGNYAAFLHRAFTYKAPLSQLAPVSGSMGYGLPAAIAAKLAAPDREVVAITGDGCFQMTGQELATAVQFGIALPIIVANNATLGTIRAAQERTYPGRPIATRLVNPDFAALARTYGAEGERADSLDAFKEILARARTSNGPYMIELLIDREALAPGIRAASAKKDKI